MSIRLISMASALALTLAASAASAMPASGEQPLFNDQADVPSVVTRAEVTAQATQSPPPRASPAAWCRWRPRTYRWIAPRW